MNLDLSVWPLPRPVRSTPHRRHQISGLKLGRNSVRRFQETAERLHTRNRVPDADVIASTGRALIRQYHGFRRAPPISLRVRLLKALRAMAEEPGWKLEPHIHERVQLLCGYDTDVRRLIPDDVPVIGGLDDAMLIDMAWPSLHPEVADYLDFRRARAELASERGVDRHLPDFDREQWLMMRDEQCAWRHYVREHGLSHYTAPAGPALFHVF